MVTKEYTGDGNVSYSISCTDEVGNNVETPGRSD